MQVYTHTLSFYLKRNLILSTMKILFIAVILNFVASSYEQQCDSAGMKKFDEATSVITTAGNINGKFPENEEQLAAWCK